MVTKTEPASPPQEEAAQAAADAPEPQPAPEAVVEPGQVEAQAIPAEPASPVVFTAEQVEEAKREAHETGRAKGQSEADGRFNAWLKKREANERDGAVYDRYHAMQDSADPEERDIFLREVWRKPEVRRAFERGEELRSQPPPEVMERLTVKAMAEVIGPFIAELQELPELKDEKRDERGLIPLDGEFKTTADHGLALFKLAIKKGVEAGIAKERQKIEGEAKKAERARVLAEVGVEPEQIEGGGSEAPLPSLEAIGKMSVEQVRKLERDGTLDKALAKARGK